jgi:hypothetical protein
MTLDTELTEGLQKIIFEMDQSLLAGPEHLQEKRALFVLLRNQLYIMRMLAAIADIDHYPNAGRDLLEKESNG